MATLKGQTIVVVGGTAGIGFGVAKVALLAQAAHVIVASSTKARVDSAVTQLQAIANGTGKVSGAVVDATKPETIEAFILSIGEIDHLVWTSGDELKRGFKDINIEEYKDIFDVRFWGAALAAQKAKFKPNGSIILTTGAALIRPPKNSALLVGLAGSVDALTRGLAVDLAPIRVNIISPGLIDTELWNNDKIPAETKAGLLALSDKLLVKRIGTTDEVAEAYLFLMKCGYITGQRIEVDGGFRFA